MKIIKILFILLLSGCAGILLGKENYIKNPNYQQENENYTISISYNRQYGFHLFAVGIILPLIPIPLYFKCDSDIYVYLYSKQNIKENNIYIFDSRYNKNLSEEENFTSMEFTFNDETILIKTLGIVAENPIGRKNIKYHFKNNLPCSKWRQAKITINDIYINNEKQPPIKFELKKKSYYEFGYLGA